MCKRQVKAETHTQGQFRGQYVIIGQEPNCFVVAAYIPIHLQLMRAHQHHASFVR